MALQLPVTQVGLEASIQKAMKNAGRNAQINLGTNARQINALAQPLGRITGQADEFTKSMEAANARVFAFGASVGIINSVTKSFGALVKNTIQVEKSLTEINSILNTNTQELQKYGNALFRIAKETGQSFEIVAQGALELARQGLDSQKTLLRLNDALILSRLSGLDAAQSVEGLTAAFNSFKSSGITTSEILNKLVVVSQKFAVSERDLIEAIKRSASVADQAGVSFDELVGIVTAVQERTSRGGAVIGNAFKTIFARIQDKGALKDLQDLGVQVQDTTGKVLPATKILENLAQQFNKLSQTEQTDLSKKLGGVYQLSNLLAAVNDLSSAQSKYGKAVSDSRGAVDEAYKKNAALNQTLDSLINRTTLSAQQLGATLGALGVTDNAKKLLGFFNGFLETIQRILGEESTLGTFVRGLAKGLGNLISGPGLALFAAIIGKLTKDLVVFGVSSLKSFFGIGKAAREIVNIEKAISNALSSNVNLQKQLYNLESDRAAQIKLMTDAVVQQEAAMRRMTDTASRLAGPLYQQGVRSTGGQGLRVPPRAAEGYSPVAQEARDINRGVGGARSGDRPVVIPNFAFGGGKRGTMVAHTGEYIVPNYANGGSAIFNRNMVQSMGLPAGAKKIGAADGFIPNFSKNKGGAADVKAGPIKAAWDAKQLTDDEAQKQLVTFYLGQTTKVIDSALARDPNTTKNPWFRLQIKAAMMAKEQRVEGQKRIDMAEVFGGLPTILTPKNSGSLATQDSSLEKLLGKDVKGTFEFPVRSVQIDSLKPYFDKYYDTDFVEKLALRQAYKLSAKLATSLNIPRVDKKRIEDVAALKEKTGSGQISKGFKSAVKGAFGGVFDAAVTSLVGTISSEQNKKQGDFDFRGGNLNTLERIFGENPVPTSGLFAGLGDFKLNSGTDAVRSMVDKVKNEIKGSATMQSQLRKAAGIKGSAAGGFIPNFAKIKELASSFPSVLGKLILSKSKDNRLNPEDSVNLIGNNFKKIFVPIKESESTKEYEDRILNRYGYKSTHGFYNDKNSAVDGYKSYKDLLEIKSGGYIDRDVKVKFFRALAENYGEGNELDVWTKNRDNFLINGTLIHSNITDASKKSKKTIFSEDLRIVENYRRNKYNYKNKNKNAGASNGFIPNFASPNAIAAMQRLLNDPAATAGEKANARAFLAKRGMGSAGSGGGVSLRYLFDRDGMIGSKGLTDMVNYAYRQSSPTATSDQVYRVFEGLAKREPNLSNLRGIAKQKGFVPNFAIDLTKSQDYIQNQRKRNFKASTYRKATGTIGSLFKSLPEKFFTDGVLGDGVQGLETNGILNLIAQNALYASSFAGPKAIKFVTEAEKYGLKVEKSLKDKLAKLVVKGASKIKGYSGGFLPNFADPLSAAIGREMSAGVPASKIYVDQSPSLRSAANPMGLMVANRRDEPVSGSQGINRAIREGRNPKTYGAANGFVPNFAPAQGGDSDGMSKAFTGLLAFQVAVSTASGFLEQAGEGGKKASEALQQLSTTLLIFGGILMTGPIKRLRELSDTVFKANKNLNQANQANQKKAGIIGGTSAGFKAGLRGEGYKLFDRRELAIFRRENNLSPRGIGSGRVAAGAGAALRGAGAVAGFVATPVIATLGAFKAVGEVAKAFTTFSSSASKSLGELAVFAAKAANSLSEFDKAAIDSVTNKRYGASLSTLGGGIMNMTGVNAIASKLAGTSIEDVNFRGSNLSLYDITEEQFKQLEKDYVSLNVAANRTKFATSEDAAGVAAKEFQARVYRYGGGKGLSDESIKDFKDEMKAFSNQAIKMQKENALAEAMAQAATESEMAAVDVKNFNIVLLKSQDIFRSFKQTEFNFNKQIDAFKALSEASIENAYNFSEFDKSVAKLQNSLNSVDASTAAKTLGLVAQTREKLFSAARQNIEGFDIQKSELGAVFRELEDTITSGGAVDFEKKLREYSTLFGTGARNLVRDTQEEFKQASLEIERQAELEKQNLRIETYRSAVAQEMASRIEAQNNQLEISASNSQKLLEYTEKIRQSRNKIQDIKFEKSLIGATESERLAAQIGRAPLLKSRAQEEAVINFKQDRTQALQTLSSFIPTNLSPQTQFGLKSQIQNAVNEVNKQTTIDGVSKTTEELYNKIISQINESITKESQARTSLIDQLKDKLVGGGVTFENSVISAAQEFKRIVIDAANQPKKISLENKIESLLQSNRNLTQEIETIPNKESDSDKYLREAQIPVKEKQIEDNNKQIKELNKQLEQLNKNIKQPIVSSTVGGNANFDIFEFLKPKPAQAPSITNLPTMQAAQEAMQAAVLQAQEQADQISLQEGQDKFSLLLKRNPNAILADRMRQADEARASTVADLLYKERTSISGREIAQSRYDIETEMQLAGAQTEEEKNKIIRDRQSKGFGQLFTEEFSTTELERANQLRDSIVDASLQFKNNMIDGLVQAVENGAELSDILRSSALEFARSMTKAGLDNLFNTATSTIFPFASGGKVTGGSGVRDDVPAMLTGGEFVINKKSVQKYGSSFLTALNNGSIGGYAAGGMVKKDYFTPGTFGQDAIEGGSNLLGFATQAYTGGANDQIFGGNGAAGVSLEPESMRLTNFGRRFGPAAEATRAAKEQAFGLYVEEYQAAAARAAQKKAEKKALKRQLAAMAITAAVALGVGAASQGFKGAFSASKAANPNNGFGTNFMAGLKGSWSGSGSDNAGGLKNLFSGIGDMAKGNFEKGYNSLKLSQLSAGDIKRAKVVSDFDMPTSASFPQNPDIFNSDPSKWNRATGGSIPFTNGIDTVPSMLSGGEFIMNRSAAQNIGAGNLQALNAGASSLVTEETSQELNDRIIAKLDELIEATGSGAGNITINVDAATGAATQATEGNTGEDRQQLARQIKDVVLKVIQDEKRIGGQLRRGM